MKIEMKSQPRSSGKTTYIKLLALEEIHKGNYQKICIIGHNGHSENIFKTWIMGIRCRLGNILIGYELLEDRILLGDSRRDYNCLVLIDEPFIMNTQKQLKLIQDLENLEKIPNVSIDVIGFGTEVEENHKFLFKDYLENNNSKINV